MPTSPICNHEVVLQRFIIDRPVSEQLLYWRLNEEASLPGAYIDRAGDGQLLLSNGATLSFDTYFNAFFETAWRQNTSFGDLRLRVDVDGPCQIRVFRQALGKKTLLADQLVSAGTTELRFGNDALSFRQQGVLSLEVTARDNQIRWRGATWLADAVARDVGLAAVFCTFNRESDISRVLRCVAADSALLQGLTRIFVVNQGRPSLASHPQMAGLALQLGSKLRIIEQANFGGAGGFTRGLLASLDDPDITHVVLLDDDIQLEPESLLRAASFFALAEVDVVLGGQMLDGAQPTRMFEAGAIISERHWAFQPQQSNVDLAEPETLERLNQINAVHYNGWWFCGYPLALIRRVGLPLPCFIRGDDVEFGLRLHQQDVPTVSMPGIAVWHDPFYLKLGSWHIYYETRNMLVSHALHQPFERWPVTRRMLRHLFIHLLTFRYYSAALILRGISDFMVGPTLLHAAPSGLHAGLSQYSERYPAKTSSRRRVLYDQPLPVARRMPRSRPGFILLIARLLLHQFFVPTRDAPVRKMSLERFAWPSMRDVEHVAVETLWDRELPTFHRSREDFRSLVAASLRVIWQLYRSGPKAAQAWRDGLPHLASVDFWRKYLDLPDTMDQPADVTTGIAA